MTRAALIFAICLAATAAHGYRGETMSLEAREIEVREVIQMIADRTGLNIITSDTVGGRLTLMLRDVPWDQALDVVLEAKGLGKLVKGHVVLIAPAEELRQKLRLAESARPIEPLYTWAFELQFANAHQVRRRLAERGALSRVGAASIDSRTNTLFVQDLEEVLLEVEGLVRRLDVAPPSPL